MTWEELFNTIRSKFKTLIADEYSLPTQYDNHNLADQKDLWCRLKITTGDTFQADCGGASGSRDRTVGAITAELKIPVGKGDKKLLQMAGNIKTAFNRKNHDGVRFKTASIKRIGRVNNEWQINVNCPFYADDIS